MRKSIIFGIAVALLVFVCGFALISPLRYSSEYVRDDLEQGRQLTLENAVKTNGCKIDGNKVTITGEDAYIAFETEQESNESIALYFSDLKENGAGAQLFYADDLDNFSERDSVRATLISGKQTVFDVDQNECRYIRLDIDTDYTFDFLSVYRTDFGKVYTENSASLSATLLVVLVSLVLGAGMAFVSYKFSVAEKIANYIKNHYKNFLKYCAFMAAAIVLAIFTDIIFDLTKEKALFVAVVLMLIAHTVYFGKNIYENMPVYTSVAIILFGLLFIFASPFAHISWDTESHYEWAVNTSYIGNAYYCKADEDIINVSEDFLYSGKDTASVVEKYNTNSNVTTKIVTNKSTNLNSIPSGIFLAIGRMLNLPFYARYCMGKLANLLCYALICYFAMKKIQSGRIILAIIALFPTNLLIAANYAYDWWVTGFIMLGVAYFVNECQHPDEPVSVKNTLIMCGAIILGCIPKLIYVPMLVLPFFVKKNNFKNRKQYYKICGVLIVALFLVLLVKTFFVAKGGGDTRGGSVSVKGQALYILHNPIVYSKVLIKFLIDYLSVEAMERYINYLAYLGQGSYAGVIVVMFIVAIITDKDKCDENASNWLIRTASVVLFLGMAALIATALYLDFTPVGSDTISGCSSRYIIPLVYPLVALLPCGVSKLKINRNIYGISLLVPCFLVILQNIYELVL